MKEVIQNIILPDSEKLKEHYRLYYRGVRGSLYAENGTTVLRFPKYSFIEFNTYFNGCSLEKWKKYTDLKSIQLSLEVSGTFLLRLNGYKVDLFNPEKTCYGEYRYNFTERTGITLDIPDNENQMVAFEIEAESECTLYSGKYIGEFSSISPVNLSLSTTTCKKEKFITKNIKTLKDRLLDSESEIARHLFIHIVDNGRTLSRTDFSEDERIYLHPNKNVGGAGGFCRGMLESLHQKDKITHVLLMDDDVLIQPESIYKTYILLKHIKERYKGCFISGAMLYLENIPIQKEDIGTIRPDASFVPLKREFNHDFLWDNLTNEKEYPLERHSYAAWWYCCIPIEAIKKFGLPLPVFVRGDDVEYGLRCRPGFITMNGICVWHMGFAGKFNVAMDHYQVNRNLLIAQAASGVLENVNVIRKARLDFRKHLLRLDYDSAEIALRAIEDYLKGPEFIKEDLGEKILIENNKLGHKMIELEKMGNPDVGLGDPFIDFPRSRLSRWLFRITYNGHRFWPSLYKKEPMTVPFNDIYTPARITFRKKLFAINLVNRTGYQLERDNQRARKLLRRYETAMRKYKRDHREIAKAYRDEKKYLISEKFWKEYLEI